MNQANQAVTSREYKLMLNVDRFKERVEGAQAFWDLVKFLAKQHSGKIVKEQKDEEIRRTMYLDTATLALSQRGFILRLREEKTENQYKLTLKYRDPDRYVSAGQDVSSPKGGKPKFEEDILPPFSSKFSHSTAITLNEEPKLNKVEDVEAFFSGVKVLKIPGEAPIEVINGFEAYEVVRKVGQIDFGDELVVKACLNFWYWLAEGEQAPPTPRFPLVVEFSFDYDVPEEPDGAELEQFPTKAVGQINHFFEALQKQPGWVDLKGTTKTAFAYEGL